MRIVIVGTQPVEGAALRRLIQIKSKIDLVDVADSSTALLALVETGDIDLVLLTGYTGDMTMSELITDIKKRENPPTVFVLDSRPETGQNVLKAGADAFFYKGEAPKNLQIAIETIRLQREDEQRTDSDGFF